MLTAMSDLYRSHKQQAHMVIKITICNSALSWLRKN